GRSSTKCSTPCAVWATSSTTSPTSTGARATWRWAWSNSRSPGAPACCAATPAGDAARAGPAAPPLPAGQVGEDQRRDDRRVALDDVLGRVDVQLAPGDLLVGDRA